MLKPSPEGEGTPNPRIRTLEIAKKRITEAFKAEAMTLQEFRKEKTDIKLGEEKLTSERDGLTNKLNIQHNIEAKIDLFKETCHKFLSKINDPKIVTERLKKAIRPPSTHNYLILCYH